MSERPPASNSVEPVGELRTELGEGPIWDGDARALWFVDITARLIHRYSPQHDDLFTLEMPQEVGAVAPRHTGGLIAAVRDGIALIDTETGGFELVAAIEANVPRNRMNDAKCDRSGRFWAGTMAFEATPRAGKLYRYDPDGTVTTLLEDLTISNGMAWTADQSTMYFIDSAHGVDAFDFDAPTGTIENRRRLITIDPNIGLPDGMTIDSDDHLWVAIWGGWRVQRYTPEGTLEREIAVPASQVTSVAFGGPALDELYITTARTGLTRTQLTQEPLAGAFFACRPGFVGTPTSKFGV